MSHALLIPSRIHSAEFPRERIVAREDDELDATDPAFCALTDFELDFPLTVDADASIDDAFENMNRLGVHALLVTEYELRGIPPQVVGLITAHEIERARPRRQSRPPCVSLDNSAVRVREAMTPWDELSLVKSQSLQTLTALDLYETFQGTGLTHLLVVELHDDGVAVVRGLLSRFAIAKRLGRVRNSVAR